MFGGVTAVIVFEQLQFAREPLYAIAHPLAPSTGTVTSYRLVHSQALYFH